MANDLSEPVLSDHIREILASHARIAAGERLRDQDDLFRAGMTSHATVSVMLALEEAFDVEFTDQMLSRDTFRSVLSIRRAVASLLGDA